MASQRYLILYSKRQVILVIERRDADKSQICLKLSEKEGLQVIMKCLKFVNCYLLT